MSGPPEDLSISLLPLVAIEVLLPSGSRLLWTDMLRPPVDLLARLGLNFWISIELGSA